MRLQFSLHSVGCQMGPPDADLFETMTRGSEVVPPDQKTMTTVLPWGWFPPKFWCASKEIGKAAGFFASFCNCFIPCAHKKQHFVQTRKKNLFWFQCTRAQPSSFLIPMARNSLIFRILMFFFFGQVYFWCARWWYSGTTPSGCSARTSGWAVTRTPTTYPSPGALRLPPVCSLSSQADSSSGSSSSRRATTSDETRIKNHSMKMWVRFILHVCLVWLERCFHFRSMKIAQQVGLKKVRVDRPEKYSSVSFEE